MRKQLALLLSLISLDTLAQTQVCESKLVNTFSRTQVGTLTLTKAGPKLMAQLKKNDGRTVISSDLYKEHKLQKGSVEFDNFIIQMKDNNLQVSKVDSLKVTKIKVGTVEFSYVESSLNGVRSVRFVSSRDGFFFGSCN
jgi:hypothetical protein